MADTLILLAYLTAVLVVGIALTFLARWLRLPNMLLLVLAGICFGIILHGRILFPAMFIKTLAVVALVLITFDVSSRFRFRRHDSVTAKATSFSLTFILFTLVCMSIATIIIFKIQSIWLAVILAAIMCDSGYSMVASLHKHRKTKVTDLLEIESVLNAPIALLFVFLTLGAIGNLVASESIAAEYLSQVYGMLRQLVTGIGLGIICGMLLFRLMQKYYRKYLSEAILFAAMFIAYFLSERLNGSGIIAVLALGIFFGNLFVKKKLELIRFNSSFAHSLLIVVSIFIGLSIQPFHDISFIIKSLALFIIFIAVRLIAIYASSMQLNISHEEKLYMALAPKGMVAAATIFCLMSYVFLGSGMIAGLGFTLLPEAVMILDLSVLLLIYSLIASSAMNYFSAK